MTDTMLKQLIFVIPLPLLFPMEPPGKMLGHRTSKLKLKLLYSILKNLIFHYFKEIVYLQGLD